MHTYYIGTPQWNKFVHDFTREWKSRVKNWIIDQDSHPVLVVRYEDLKQDTIGEVKRMLNFLKIPCDEQEIEERLREDFGTFHRKHTDDDFEHYNSAQKMYIKSQLIETIRMVETKHKSDVLRLDDYLTPFQ